MFWIGLMLLASSLDTFQFRVTKSGTVRGIRNAKVWKKITIETDLSGIPNRCDVQSGLAKVLW